MTANLPITAWDEIFPSTSMTVAAVDRLVLHCHIIEISGDSHRKAQASRRSGSKQPQQTERIGKQSAQLDHGRRHRSAHLAVAFGTGIRIEVLAVYVPG